MTGRGAVSYRERFVLWNGNQEVPGGPYFRPQAVERAAERVLAKFPTAPLYITREELRNEQRPGGLPGDIVQKWVSVGAIWENPNGIFTQ